jgi:hypothetical protein
MVGPLNAAGWTLVRLGLAGEDCSGNSGNQAMELKIADPPKQKTGMAGSSSAMTVRIVACESLSLKTRRDEPPLGLDVI